MTLSIKDLKGGESDHSSFKSRSFSGINMNEDFFFIFNVIMKKTSVSNLNRSVSIGCF